MPSKYSPQLAVYRRINKQSWAAANEIDFYKQKSPMNTRG